MSLRETKGTTGLAYPFLRVFAGIVALPMLAGGVLAIVAEFPVGLVTGVPLFVLGVAAGYYASHGREPRWFRG